MTLFFVQRVLKNTICHNSLILIPMDTPVTHQTLLSRFTSLDTTLAPVAQAVLRIGAGLLFMQHGAQKLFGVLGGTQAELLSQMGVAGVLEFFGGALIVAGLFTRPVAAVLVLQMIAAYFIAHVPRAVFPVENNGELALLFALIFGFLAAAGPGRWSVDGLRAR